MESRGLTSEDFHHWGVIRDDASRLVRAPIRSFRGNWVLDIVRNFDPEKPRYDVQPSRSRPGHVLHGLYNSWELIKRQNFVIVVEGFTDVMALFKHRLPVVAALTSQLTEVHIAMLELFADYILIWGDGDEAGRDFAQKIPDSKAIVTGMSVQGYDPADLHGAGYPIEAYFQTVTPLADRLRYVELKVSQEVASATARDV